MEVKVSDKAFQLAKEWVKNMSGGNDGDIEETEESELRIDVRPARLGLGAKYVPHTQLTTTLNPVEKKLRAKLDASKAATHVAPSKASRGADKSNEGKNMKEDSDEEEEGSRASLFNRKQTSNSLNTHLIQLEPSKGSKKRKNG